MECLGNYKNTLDTKRAHILKDNCIYILYKKIVQYRTKRVNYVLGYSILKIIEK